MKRQSVVLHSSVRAKSEVVDLEERREGVAAVRGAKLFEVGKCGFRVLAGGMR